MYKVSGTCKRGTRKIMLNVHGFTKIPQLLCKSMYVRYMYKISINMGCLVRNHRLFLLLVLLSTVAAVIFYHWLNVRDTSMKLIRQDPSTSQVGIHSSPSHKITKDMNGFVTALRYSGQQGSGIKALKSLQCWASTLSVPMLILEPTIASGILVSDITSTGTSNNSSHITLTNLFDTSFFNKVASENNLAQLTTRDYFFEHASKKIMLVLMDWVSRSVPEEERQVKVLWPEITRTRSNQCLDPQKAPSGWRKYTRSFSMEAGYCIVKVVQAPFSPARRKIFSQEEARDAIYGSWLPNEVTTVFTLWREGWYTPMTSKSTTISDCPTPNLYKPSKKIVDRVKWYEHQILGGKATLSIMFRLERMVEFLHESHQMDVDKCLTEVIKLSDTIRKQHDTKFSKPFVTLDFGDSGSTSWATTTSHFGLNLTDLIAKTKKTLSTIFKGEWSYKTWEATLNHAAEGNTNPGYIAALQRTIASRSKCLILVGGGHFQSIALNDYLQDHPNKSQQCVHFVCAKAYLTKLNDGA